MAGEDGEGGPRREQVRLSLVTAMFVLSSAMNDRPLEPRLSIGRGFFVKSAALQLLESFPISL